MKKIIFYSILMFSFWGNVFVFAESNDQLAIRYTNEQLQNIFKILKSQPNTISHTCIESLKKLHAFKDKITQDKQITLPQKEINDAILRSLYTNTIDFCQVDAEDICSHRNASIRSACNHLSSK